MITSITLLIVDILHFKIKLLPNDNTTNNISSILSKYMITQRVFSSYFAEVALSPG